MCSIRSHHRAFGCQGQFFMKSDFIALRNFAPCSGLKTQRFNLDFTPYTAGKFISIVTNSSGNRQFRILSLVTPILESWLLPKVVPHGGQIALPTNPPPPVQWLGLDSSVDDEVNDGKIPLKAQGHESKSPGPRRGGFNKITRTTKSNKITWTATS